MAAGELGGRDKGTHRLLPQDEVFPLQDYLSPYTFSASNSGGITQESIPGFTHPCLIFDSKQCKHLFLTVNTCAEHRHFKTHSAWSSKVLQRAVEPRSTEVLPAWGAHQQAASHTQVVGRGALLPPPRRGHMEELQQPPHEIGVASGSPSLIL